MPAIPWPIGTGANVVGPGTTTDDALVRWNGTSGGSIQDSPIVCDDSGNLTGVGTINGNATDIKVYRALLTQNGTDAPVATVLENSLGGEVIWTRDDVGTYRGTLADAFPYLKTAITFTGGSNGSSVTTSSYVPDDDDDLFQVFTFDGPATPADSLIKRATVEILVYP